MERPPFLDQEAPPNYVAGIGRGAYGFATKKEQYSERNSKKIPKRFQNNERLQDSEEFQIFEMIDKRMIESKKRYKNKTKIEKYDNQNDKSSNNNDLKREMEQISYEEWENLPDAKDMTKMNKRLRIEEQMNRKTYAAPDSLSGKDKNGDINLFKLTEEREKLLGQQLDAKIANNEIDNNTEIEEYLKELNNSMQNRENIMNEELEVDNLKRTRLIMKSYIKSDPKNSKAWITISNIEKRMGNIEKAKRLINEGCLHCYNDENIWIENLKIHNNSEFKIKKSIIEKGIKYNRKSLKLWKELIKIDDINKKRILRKSIIEIPNEEYLWIELIKIIKNEEEGNKENYYKMLKKSIEFIKKSEILWEELIYNTQDYINSKKLLSEYRNNIVVGKDNNIKIWIIASEIEEREDKGIDKERLNKLIKKGMNNNKEDIIIDKWMNEMCKVYDRGYYKTCESIIYNLFENIGEEEKNKAFDYINISNVKEGIKRMVYKEYLKKEYQDIVKIKEYINMIQDDNKDMNDLLNIIVNGSCQEEEEYIVSKRIDICEMYITEIEKRGVSGDNINKIMNIIDKLRKVWIDNYKIEILRINYLYRYNDKRVIKYEEINEIFNKLIKINPDILKIKIEYIKFLNYNKIDKRIIKKFISDNIKDKKINIRLLSEEIENTEELEELILVNKEMEKNIGYQVYIKLSEFYEKEGNIGKARIILNKKLLLLEKEELVLERLELIYYIILFEIRNGYFKEGKNITNRVLTTSPSMLEIYPDLKGLIWREKLRLELQEVENKNNNNNKLMFQEALKASNNHSAVLHTIAEWFLGRGQKKTGIKWLTRALAGSGVSNGDAWISWYNTSEDEPGHLPDLQTEEPTSFYRCAGLYGVEWAQAAAQAAGAYRSAEEIAKQSKLETQTERE